MLRLVRDRTVVKLFLVLGIVYQLRLMLAAAGDTPSTVADSQKQRSFAPVSLVVDLLGMWAPKSGPFGGVVGLFGKYKSVLDGAARAVLPSVLAAVAEGFLSWIRGATK